ncbi:MAG: MBL fold metallo-hydrolase [Deltaproteobacteria bacterium]|nr:MBL fold metallo-hydrolase [Deltaproteobacteria bacterium]
MIIGERGKIAEGFYVVGSSWSPSYCLVSRETIIFEAGFSCMARYHLSDIREISPLKSPSILFITHVHYDHCGSASIFKKEFPEMIIACSERAKEILKRENAIKLMKRLSNNVLRIMEKFDWVEKERLLYNEFEPFHVDKVLNDGDVIEIEDNLHVVVITTPGHTRDHLSYYIPEREILICTEACGCLDRAGNLIPEFLVDYDTYLDSLFKLSKLPVRILCQGHHFVFTDKDVQDFFSLSVRKTEEFKSKIEELLEREDHNIEKVVRMVKQEQYETNRFLKQPEEAYLINLTTRVKHLSDRLRKNKVQ